MWEVDKKKPKAPHKDWLQYAPDLQKQIWKWYHDKPENDHEWKTKDGIWIINLHDKTQKNPDTGMVREIRCVEKEKPVAPDPIPDEIPTRPKYSQEEIKEQQREFYMTVIVKY